MATLGVGAGVMLLAWAVIDRLTMPRSDQQDRSQRMLLGAGFALAVAGAIFSAV